MFISVYILCAYRINLLTDRTSAAKTMPLKKCSDCCNWPPDNSAYEKLVFRISQTKTYVVGT